MPGMMQGISSSATCIYIHVPRYAIAQLRDIDSLQTREIAACHQERESSSDFRTRHSNCEQRDPLQTPQICIYRQVQGLQSSGERARHNHNHAHDTEAEAPAYLALTHSRTWLNIGIASQIPVAVTRTSKTQAWCRHMDGHGSWRRRDHGNGSAVNYPMAAACLSFYVSERS